MVTLLCQIIQPETRYSRSAESPWPDLDIHSRTHNNVTPIEPLYCPMLLYVTVLFPYLLSSQLISLLTSLINRFRKWLKKIRSSRTTDVMQFKMSANLRIYYFIKSHFTCISHILNVASRDYGAGLKVKLSMPHHHHNLFYIYITKQVS